MAGVADTVELLTPPGVGAIAVVRVCGEGVERFVTRHVSRKLSVGRAVHGKLLDGDEVIDEPLLVMTEERCLEIHLHGGEWVVRKAMELAERAGFKRATAEVNDGDVWEREMLASLPLATTDFALRVLLAQPALWREAERRGLTQSERDAIVADKALWWLLHPPRVAIVGAANVGKSTIANQLFGQERSITADLPGTTRDWVGEMANIDGLAVMLIDTPGVRESDDPIEQEAIRGSRAVKESADLVIEVIEARNALGSTSVAGAPRIVVANKWDLAGDKSDIPGDGGVAGVIPTVGVTGFGIDALKRAICGRFACRRVELTKPRWWTEDQRRRLDADL